MAIESFSHKGLERLFRHGEGKLVRADLRIKCTMICEALDAATDIQDIAPMRGFHGLKGARRGDFAVTVSANYRITFRWTGADVSAVDLEDYH